VEKQSQAIAILDRIKQGEKFGKLAKELSIDSGSAKRDGSLGYFSRGKMVKEFEKAAFSLEVGKISEPIKTQYGYHIIKRLS
jgi:foldase protein PrsA